MDQFLKIKKLLLTGLSVNYKRLSIGKISHDSKTLIQVDCDRFDLIESRIYTEDNIDFAISKFTVLLTRYIASELKHGE